MSTIVAFAVLQLAYVAPHHISKAEALLLLIGGPIFLTISASLGTRKRYLVYLSAIATASIFLLFVAPLLPPEWNTVH